MRDQAKTKAQLMEELAEMRARVAQLEATQQTRQGARATLEEQGLFDLFEALPAVVYLQAPDYSIRFANRAFRELHGDPAGRPCYTVIHGRLEPCVECPTFRVFETGEPQAWEWTHPTETRMYQVCEYPFTDADGSPLVLDLAFDITALKLTQEALGTAEHEKAAILNSMTELVAFQDPEMTIIWANRAAGESVGLTPQDLAGHRCYEIWHQRNEPCEGCPVLKTWETGLPQEGEIVSPDGRMWRIRGYPVVGRGGKMVGAVEVTLDVTEWKRAEEALKQYSGRLEEMVKERSKELEETQEELISKERLAMLGQLAGGVSHELRNPLATISNAVYFLQMTLAQADETTKEYLQIIAAQVQDASKIISDLLSFARETPADSQSVSPAKLGARIWEKRALPKGIQIVTHLPPDLPPVFVDPQQMTQVLENLVTNAYEAMPQGGKLIVKARADRNKVYLSMADTGEGIAEENLGRLFEPLFSTKPRGVGLGLALSKMLVEANGGRIEVESQEGKGTTFTLILPIAEGHG